MRPNLIIGFTSPWPRCGKSTASDMLLHEFINRGHPSIRHDSMAAPIKNTLFWFLVHEVFMNAPDASERAWRYLFDYKTEIIPELGVTGRHLMQTFGTEFGRECISQDVWVKLFKLRQKQGIYQGTVVIIDDVRFQEEVDLIRDQKGYLIRIQRMEAYPTDPEILKHRSEGLGAEADTSILNDADKDTLREHISELVGAILEGRRLLDNYGPTDKLAFI